MSHAYQRCDVCGRATTTKDGEVKSLEVCWDAEREQMLCMRCYQLPQLQSRPDRKEALRLRREQKI